jgi:hypothetical protein
MSAENDFLIARGVRNSVYINAHASACLEFLTARFYYVKPGPERLEFQGIAGSKK